MGIQNMSSEPIKVFYSYSHIDESFAKDLDKYLVMLKRKKIIDTWFDRKIGAGEEWEKRIEEELNQAQITILLISIDFMNSEYCYEKELAKAMVRHELGETVIIPIIIRKIPNINETPFSKFQFLPKDGKPVDHWENAEDAWVDIAEGITKQCHNIIELRSKRINNLNKNWNQFEKDQAQNIFIQMEMDDHKQEMELWKMSQVPGIDPNVIFEIRQNVMKAKAETSKKLFEKWDTYINE
jgi:hypothetical protein